MPPKVRVKVIPCVVVIQWNTIYINEHNRIIATSKNMGPFYNVE